MYKITRVIVIKTFHEGRRRLLLKEEGVFK